MNQSILSYIKYTNTKRHDVLNYCNCHTNKDEITIQDIVNKSCDVMFKIFEKERTDLEIINLIIANRSVLLKTDIQPNRKNSVIGFHPSKYVNGVLFGALVEFDYNDQGVCTFIDRIDNIMAEIYMDNIYLAYIGPNPIMINIQPLFI